MTTQSGLVRGWDGPMRPYDLVKEGAVAVVVIASVVIALALAFGSPKRTAVTLQEWATDDPIDMATTTLGELDGTSATATYGPPYTADASDSQELLGVSPARIAGVSIPINAAEDIILGPLSTFAPTDPELAAAIDAYRSSSPTDISAWGQRYRSSLATAEIADGSLVVTPGDYGPLDTLVEHVVTLAADGSFTGALIDGRGGRPAFYTLDTTRSMMFLADGAYFDQLATDAGLAGDQWGAMNTLDNWPGQWWLGPFSVWYQFPPGSTSANADLLIAVIMGVLTGGVVFLPWIPGLRSLPVRSGFHRLVWRRSTR
ncbi:MAG: hypothetical protein KDB21_02860 [Acidimicrobiales bacterium]|nr:hypothetical protein [Acidimicrobiales bacterium]